MIQIKNILQSIYIYQNSFNSTSGTNSLILVNDLSQINYNLDFDIPFSNSNYSEFLIDFSTSGLTIQEGYYTLNFYSNDAITYTERVQYSIPIIIIDIGNSSIIDEDDKDNYYSIVSDN